MKVTKRAAVLAGSVAILAAGALGGTAYAASSSPPKPGNAVVYGCVSGSTRTLEHVTTSAASFKGCPKGSFGIAFNEIGPRGLTGARGVAGATGPQGKTGAQGPAGTAGATGPAGTQGPAGAQGPSGVVSTGTTQLVPSPVSIPTGGSFSKRATQVGTIKLAAGTYLLNVNAKATPNATTSGEVFPQLMVYNGAQLPDFSNNLFNVGAGALENPSATELSQGTLIDSYYTGSNEITVPAGGETLHVYAFGYDSDTGQGTYALDSVAVTATQVTPAQG